MRKFWNWIRDDGGGRTLRLDGPIDVESLWSDGVTPKVFREDLYAEDGDVTVYINSPGGNVFAAAEIYTMIRDYPGHVTVKIDAIAASAASVVAMAGDRVMVSPVGMIMIHDPVTIAMGNSKAMEKAISTLNEVKESIVNAYQAKTGLSRNKIAKLMSDESWFNAKKAVELGFADEIMFDDMKSDPKADPDGQDDGGQDGNDAPEEGENGRVHLKAPKAADALEGLLYSTRTMGQAILNSIGAFDEGETPDEGTAPDDGDAADGGNAETEGGDSQETPAEDAPEGETPSVAEDSETVEEATPLTGKDETSGTASEAGAVDEDEADGVDEVDDDINAEASDTDEAAAEPTAVTEACATDEADVALAVDDVADAESADSPVEEAKADAIPEDEPREPAPDDGDVAPAEEAEGDSAPSNVLPDGFFAVDVNGRTPDGSVPYFILKNQLERMR